MTPDDIAAHIEELGTRYAELEKSLADPSVYSRPKECKRLSSERGKLKRVLDLYQNWTRALQSVSDNQELLHTENDPEFRSFIESDIAEQKNIAEKKESELRLSLIPGDRADGRDAIVEIRPGAGGEEAALFAAEMYRMYTKFAERKGWTLEPINIADSELGGVKEAIFSLSGEDVFSHMKYESGVHRVQRVPATEASGRIHTSTITVSVLPEAEELDEIEIRHEDLEISTFRSSGPGGQNVNRTDSAVRMVHKPSGIVVVSQQERSQIRNREIALRILKAKLLEIRRREEAERQVATKRSQTGTGDRSERIRTYNFPQNRITDHRFNVSSYDLPGLMEGDLEQILGPIREVESTRAMEDLLSGKPE